MNFFAGTYAIVLPSGSPKLEEIDLGLLSLRESGKLRELENKWFSGVCTDFIMDSSHGSRIQLPPFYKVVCSETLFTGSTLIGVIAAAVVAIDVVVVLIKPAKKKIYYLVCLQTTLWDFLLEPAYIETVIL